MFASSQQALHICAKGATIRFMQFVVSYETNVGFIQTKDHGCPK